MTELSQKQRERLDEIQPLLSTIDVSKGISPSTVGAINTVAAAGIEISESGTKLLILKSRGVITKEEFLWLAGHFVGQDMSNNGQKSDQ